jgi:glycine dehydrogenase subunit 1
VSQGTLIAIFEYQTAICRLTGMDVANASMYDGATALAEAVFMSIRTSGRTGVIIPDSVHPHYRDVLKTYAWANDITITELPSVNGIIDSQKLQVALSDKMSAVVVQSPNFFGILESLTPLAEIAHKAGAHLIHLTTEALALSLLKAPGKCGADIICGEGLSFGNYPGFGGPALGILAAKEPFIRRMPGRLVGKSVDADGKTAYCLTLQTREQHIRRERATSNICSNEGLCALRASIYLSLLGNNLRALGKLNHDCSSYLKRKLAEIGITTKFFGPFFNEFVIQVGNPSAVITAMREKGFSIGVDLGRWYPAYKDCILIACTELNTPASIDAMTSALSTIMKKVK